jgi:outer membrane protein OmpA-like peptidoglycan-associated protein
MGHRDQYSGMYSGTAETGPTLQVATTRVSDKEAMVAAKIKDSEGYMLGEVTVTDKTTGHTTTSQFKNGLLGFVGVKGRTYTLSVTDKNNHVQSKDLTIPANGDVDQNIDVFFGDQPSANKTLSKPLSMTAHVFKQDDNLPLAGATVTILGLEVDLELQADNGGNVTFTLPEGAAFILMAHRDQYSGMYSGTAQKGPALQVPTTRVSEKQTMVAAKIKNTEGYMLDEVTVTDKTTGQTTTSQFKNGLLGFVGVKGRTYTLVVTDKNNHTQSQDVTIAADGGAEQSIDVAFGDRQNTNKNTGEAVSMTAHVFKLDDNQPLAGASITILGPEADLELKADNDGNVAFTLPDGTAFILIANRDAYSGMYSGMVEKGPVLQVATTQVSEKETLIAGKLRDDQGYMLGEVTVTVTNKTTGEISRNQFKNGLLGFVGVKGHTYTISVEEKNHHGRSKDITIADNAGTPAKIDVVFENQKEPTASTMIRLKNDGSGDKIYISTGKSNAEIIERNGVLYFNDGTGERTLGNGTIAKLQNDPNTLKQFGLSFDEIIEIENIYFDYNKTSLDATDKKELDKAGRVLKRYPHLQLTISAHADDRGSDKYNLNLSKRRAKTIASYLAKNGVNRSAVNIEAHGESVPAIPCISGECNEEQRQKNRRAEFSLTSSGPVVATQNSSKSKTKTVSHKNATSSHLDETLAKYGDRTAEGLSFKISIGAYRFNHTLTFDELKDLGTVEKVNVDGITYYYLSSFTTMRSAEAVKKEVVSRGVKDAFVSIFRGEERITFKEFLVMVEEDERIAGMGAK